MTKWTKDRQALFNTIVRNYEMMYQCDCEWSNLCDMCCILIDYSAACDELIQQLDSVEAKSHNEKRER